MVDVDNPCPTLRISILNFATSVIALCFVHDPSRSAVGFLSAVYIIFTVCGYAVDGAYTAVIIVGRAER